MHYFRTGCDFWGCPVQGHELDFDDLVGPFQLRDNWWHFLLSYMVPLPLTCHRPRQNHSPAPCNDKKLLRKTSACSVDLLLKKKSLKKTSMSCTFQGAFTAENIPVQEKKEYKWLGKRKQLRWVRFPGSLSHLFNIHWAHSSKSMFRNPGSIAHLFLPVWFLDPEALWNANIKI